MYFSGGVEFQSLYQLHRHRRYGCHWLHIGWFSHHSSGKEKTNG